MQYVDKQANEAQAAAETRDTALQAVLDRRITELAASTDVKFAKVDQAVQNLVTKNDLESMFARYAIQAAPAPGSPAPSSASAAKAPGGLKN